LQGLDELTHAGSKRRGRLQLNDLDSIVELCSASLVLPSPSISLLLCILPQLWVLT
jgi:hypothetical protein